MKYPLNRMVFRCEKCGGSLEVLFDYFKMSREVNREKLRSREFSHSRYIEFFPVIELVSLKEGGTPLIRSRNIEREQKLKFELYFKNEAVNPTGSFKDRGSSVEISKALEFRAKRGVCASTGNMGASVAAYSSLVGLPCHIFTPKDSVATKIQQILAYGAKLYRVSGDYSRAAEMVEEAFRSHKAYLLGDYLYRREGTKSVGYEIIDQMDFRMEGTSIFVPVGNGTLISAIWKACKEMYMMGLSHSKPRLCGIQSSRCDPVTRAFTEGSPIGRVSNPETIAKAIECGDPLDGERALRSVEESNGFARNVTDREILRARGMLAEREGLFAEPAGAVSLAGLLKAKDDVPIGSRVVCIVTGHGLKNPVTDVSRKEERIKGDVSVVKDLFK